MQDWHEDISDALHEGNPGFRWMFGYVVFWVAWPILYLSIALLSFLFDYPYSVLWLFGTSFLHVWLVIAFMLRFRAFEPDIMKKWDHENDVAIRTDPEAHTWKEAVIVSLPLSVYVTIALVLAIGLVDWLLS